MTRFVQKRETQREGHYKKKKGPLNSVQGIVHPKWTFHHLATHPCFSVESRCTYSPMQLLFANTNGNNSNDWIYMETKDLKYELCRKRVQKKRVSPVWTATRSQLQRVFYTIFTIWPLTYMFKKQETQLFYTFRCTLCVLHWSACVPSVAAGWNSVKASNFRLLTANPRTARQLFRYGSTQDYLRLGLMMPFKVFPSLIFNCPTSAHCKHTVTHPSSAGQDKSPNFGKTDPTSASRYAR